jgi:LEA14-like dessication related protein
MERGLAEPFEKSSLENWSISITWKVNGERAKVRIKVKVKVKIEVEEDEVSRL